MPVTGKVTSPHPFPGRWPTRLAWYVGDRNGLSYVGKPTTLAWRETQRIRQANPFEPFYAVEFDRNLQPIVHFSDMWGTLCDPLWFSFYHFWQSPGTGMQYLALRTHPKRLAGYTIYSAYQNLAEVRKQDWLAYAKATKAVAPEVQI